MAAVFPLTSTEDADDVAAVADADADADANAEGAQSSMSATSHWQSLLVYW